MTIEQNISTNHLTQYQSGQTDESKKKLEAATTQLQAIYRGSLSRQNEAKVITKVLSCNEEGKPIANVTSYTGKLGHITGHEKDDEVKSSFTVATVKKEHAHLQVMSNGTGLFLPNTLINAPTQEASKGYVMINGGFFEMLKPGSKDEGKCYGVKAGTPIGPSKTISSHSSEEKIAHNTAVKIVEDKLGSIAVKGLGGKTYLLNQGSLVPENYEDKYGILRISSEKEIEIKSYLHLKASSEQEINQFTNDTESCVSGAPILIEDGVVLMTNEEVSQDKYQFPADGICGPGELFHGSTANPRSAIGYNEEEVKVLYAVGINHGVGYKIDKVNGLSFSQLARLVQQLGLKEALNLDGGGSCFIAAVSEKGEKMADIQGNRDLSNYVKIDIV